MISVRSFRWVALLEATSFLVLLFFSVVSRDESMISVLGPVHGFLFVAYELGLRHHSSSMCTW